MSEGTTCQDCFVGILQLAAGALVCNMCGSQSQRIVDTQTEMEDIFNIDDGKLVARRIHQKKKKLTNSLDFSSNIQIDELTIVYVECIMRLTQVVCNFLISEIGFDEKLKDVVRQLFLSYIAKIQIVKPGYTTECYTALRKRLSTNFDTEEQKKAKEQQQQQYEEEESKKKEEEEFGEFFEGIQDELQEQGTQPQTEDQQQQEEEEKEEKKEQKVVKRKPKDKRDKKAIKIKQQEEQYRKMKELKKHLRLEFRKVRILRVVLNCLLPGYSCLNFALAGLLMMREAVTAIDLIRWVHRGILPLTKTYDYVADIINASSLGDLGIHILRSMMLVQTRKYDFLGWDFSHLEPFNIESHMFKIFTFCEVVPPPINWPLLLKRIVDELQLPRAIYSVAYNIIHTIILERVHNGYQHIYKNFHKVLRRCREYDLEKSWAHQVKHSYTYRVNPVVWVVVAVANAIQITYNLGAKNSYAQSKAFQEKLENVPKEPNWSQWAVDNINRLELPLENLNFFRGLIELPSDQFHKVVTTRVRGFLEPPSLQGLRPDREIWVAEYRQIFRDFAQKHKGAEQFNDDMYALFLQKHIEDIEQHADQSSEGDESEGEEDEDEGEDEESGDESKFFDKWRGLRRGATLPEHPGYLTPDLMSIICTLAAFLWMQPTHLVDIYLSIAVRIEQFHNRMPSMRLQNPYLKKRAESPPVPEQNNNQDGEGDDQGEEENEFEKSEQSQQVEEDDQKYNDIQEDQEMEQADVEQDEVVEEQQEQQQPTQYSGNGMVLDTSMLQMVGENVENVDFNDYDFGF
eukprot:TRINITY_DN17161_c0_g1_i12.p1 TRINITY_DN17161_c0_g1~~TRINITY_DN17161_c0_g1_i12.p1  ORF type:complete len:797 (-),score=170.11 TRINITY_DN17161_c0_g1_i12:107-2497(-)